MALDIYVSDDTPLQVAYSVHDGVAGSTSDKLLYVRNDDPLVYYTGITVQIEGEGEGVLAALVQDGWKIKFIAGSRRPTEAEWDRVVWGEPVSLNDIGTVSSGDTSTYRDFWMRVEASGNQRAGVVSSLSIVVDAVESPVED